MKIKFFSINNKKAVARFFPCGFVCLVIFIGYVYAMRL